jgi:transposase
MPETRRTLTDELKREAVKLVRHPKKGVTHMVTDLVIKQSVLRHRVSQDPH